MCYMRYLYVAATYSPVIFKFVQAIGTALSLSRPAEWLLLSASLGSSSLKTWLWVMSFNGLSTMVQFASLSLCHTSLSWLGVGDCLELALSEWDFASSKLWCTCWESIGSFFGKLLTVGLGKLCTDKMASSLLLLPVDDWWCDLALYVILQLFVKLWWFGGTYSHIILYHTILYSKYHFYII